jgi:hypothetical protein
MTYNYDDPDSSYDEKPKEKKPAKPKLKRCARCRNHVESDGYGELVHAETNLYFEYDSKGTPLHAATV